jgi:hypothetical protein
MRMLAITLFGLLGMVASVAAAEEAAWREAGQIVDRNYIRNGALRYIAEGPSVQFGNNCRAMVLSWKLRPAMKLETVTLETLSQDVVIGLMGVSLMNPAK